MQTENFYFHCGTQWSDDDCDSYHNDRCPECNAEIEPYKSEDSDGEVVHHPLSPDLACDLVDAMGEKAHALIEKANDVRGLDIEVYVGSQMMATLAAKSRANQVTSESRQQYVQDSVVNAGNQVQEALSILIDDMKAIRGIDIDDYAGTEIHATLVAARNWDVYCNILGERTPD